MPVKFGSGISAVKVFSWNQPLHSGVSTIVRFRQLLVLFSAIAVTAAPLAAAEGGFTATLSEPKLAATGITLLSTEERSALNALVSREVALARQGDIPAFAGTFNSRRSPEERIAAGLDRLSPEELARLDELVAAVIASGPIVPVSPNRLTDKEVTHRDRFKTHGEVSLMYGWQSGGGTIRGASFYAETFDRETGMSIGVGISQFEGDGLRYYDRGYYGDGYYRGPLSSSYRSRGAFPGSTVCRPR